MNKETPTHLKPMSSKDAWLAGVLIGVGTIAILTLGPKIKPAVEELLLSSNPNDYSIEIVTTDGVCYANQFPILSEALQIATINNTYCPLGIDGKTRFIEISIPTKEIIKVNKIK